MNCYGISDVGLVRKANQDAFSISTNDNQALLALVCDGIGGGKAGDVAALETVDFIENAFKEVKFSDKKAVVTWIESTITSCNTYIYNLAKSNSRLEGMGTTLVGFVKCEHGTFIFSAGDSRVYALYDKLILLSLDHNLAADLLASGDFSEAEITKYPNRHLLTSAIGVWEESKVDINKIRDDYTYLLLCSDGLHGLVDERQIEKILLSDLDLTNKAKLLVESAKLHGGSDNITVILAQN